MLPMDSVVPALRPIAVGFVAAGFVKGVFLEGFLSLSACILRMLNVTLLVRMAFVMRKGVVRENLTLARDFAVTVPTRSRYKHSYDVILDAICVAQPRYPEVVEEAALVLNTWHLAVLVNTDLIN